MQQATYPVQFSIDYPDRPLDRLTTFFRVFTAIPISIVLGTVAGGTWQWSYGSTTAAVAAGAGGLLFFGPLLAGEVERAASWALDVHQQYETQEAHLAAH